MPSQQASYLETELRTASPQKLRYLLICGALRFGRQTLSHWERDETEQAAQSLTRCRRIIAELMTGIEENAPLNRQVLALYAFMFRALTEAQAERSDEKVRQVMRVLQEERQTWQEVCEQMPEAPSGVSTSPGSTEVTASDAAAMLPIEPTDAGNESPPTSFDSRQAPESPSNAHSASPPGGFSWQA